MTQEQLDELDYKNAYLDMNIKIDTMCIQTISLIYWLDEEKIKKSFKERLK